MAQKIFGAIFSNHHWPPATITHQNQSGHRNPSKLNYNHKKRKTHDNNPKKITTTITTSTTKTATTTITPPPHKIDPSHHIHIVTATIEPPKKPKAKKPSTVGPPPLVDLHDVVIERERERERERDWRGETRSDKKERKKRREKYIKKIIFLAH